MSLPVNRPDNNLVDEFGREVTYLRVSLTGQCNMRCVYCYGSLEGPIPPDNTLTDDQLLRLIRSFARLGVRKIRFTGGEPLVRPGLVEIIRETAAIDGIALVGITTNGLLLKKRLPALVDAGLNRLNISLDTLQRDRFRKITGVDGFDRVYGGLTSAMESGWFPIIKVNTVVIRGVNDDEVPTMARWALSRNIDIRFIEFMPTLDSGWESASYVPEDEMRKGIDLKLHPLAAADVVHGPARSYGVSGLPGRVSFISAVSHNFCDGCNRLRLSAEGEIIGCLFGNGGRDLRPLLQLCDNDALEEQISQVIAQPGFRRHQSLLPLVDSQPCMRRVGG